MTTWDEARGQAAVHLALEGSDWEAAPWGYEDHEAYWVPVGPAEWLLTGAPSLTVMDPPIVLVSKATGALEVTSYLTQPDRLEAMTPVGAGHPEGTVQENS